MDVQPVTFSGLPHLSPEARSKLASDLWLTSPTIHQLLTEQGIPLQGDGLTIELAMAAIMEGLQTICRENEKEAFYLQFEQDVAPHDTLMYPSVTGPLPVISLAMLDTIINGPERYRLIRIIRGDRSDLSKEIIAQLQRFVLEALRLLSDKPD